jgi:uncharacterized protein with GYD domain
MIFITQGRYTQQARAAMLASPDERAPALEQLLKAAGVKLVNAFWTFGEYDFLVVVDAPDEHAWMQVLLVASATGGIADFRTMLALPMAEGDKDYAAAAELARGFHAAAD